VRFSPRPSSASRDDDDSLLRPWHNSTINSSRLLLALKAALACMLAYMVAPFMPGVVAQYPYYAPLGALVAMYPSLAGSLRTAGQTLLGLGVGMILALLVQLTPWPVVITLFPAIALGVILAGVRRFGAGADYIPITALFVLVVGGPNADNYSLGYIVQMATGAAIGLICATSPWRSARPARPRAPTGWRSTTSSPRSQRRSAASSKPPPRPPRATRA
jgi:uncharacterized membrane protein YccC